MQLKSNKVRIIACLLVLVMTITVVSLNNPFGVFADTEEPTFEVATEDTADFELDFGDSGDSGDFDEPDNSDHGDNANNFDNNDNDSIGGNDNDTNDSNDNNLNNEPEPNEPNDTPAPPETEVSNVPESLPETGATDIPDSPETGANNIPDNIFSPEPDNDLPNINNVAPATPEMPLLPRVPLGTRDAANLTVADITSLNLTSNAAVQFVGDMVLFSTSPVANGFVQGNLEYAVDWQATQNGREILSHSTSGTQSANVVRFVVLETGDLLVTATVQGTGITARATVEVRSNGDDENLGGSSNESSGENSTENSSENLNTPNVTPAATPPHSPVAPIETLPPGTSVANTPIPSDWWWDGNTWRPPVNWSGGDGWWWDGNTWRPPNWSGGDGWWWDGGTWRPPNWNSDWWWDGGTWRPPNWNSDWWWDGNTWRPPNWSGGDGWWWDGNTWRPPNWSGGDGWWWDGNTWRPPNWSGGDGWWWDGNTWRPPNWNNDWWWDGNTWRPPNWSGGDGWWWDGNTWRPPNWSGGNWWGGGNPPVGWWWDNNTGTWNPPRTISNLPIVPANQPRETAVRPRPSTRRPTTGTQTANLNIDVNLNINNDNPTTAVVTVPTRINSRGIATLTVTDSAIIQAISDVRLAGREVRRGISSFVVRVEALDSGIDGVNATLQRGNLNRLASANATLQVVANGFMIEFDPTALRQLNEDTSGNLRIDIAPPLALSQDFRNAVGDNPVFNFDLVGVPAGTLSRLAQGGMTMGIASQAPGQFVATATNGQVTEVASTYEDGWLKFNNLNSLFWLANRIG